MSNTLLIIWKKNPANNEEYMPLDIAAEKGHLEIVKYIENHFEDKNPAHNNAGCTPLHTAAHLGYFEFVKYISDHIENEKSTRSGG